MVQAPTLSRVTGWALAVLGLLLVVGGLFAGHVEVTPLVVGLVMAVLGPSVATAHALCTVDGVVYRNLLRYRLDAAEITRVEVERRGWTGTFPTLVVYRRAGRPVVLRAVQEYRSPAGQSRMEARAATWRTVLALNAA